MSPANRLPLALFLLRGSVFLVMFMWTLDKFVRPDHAGSVFEHFYGLEGFGPFAMRALGALELALLIAFALGVAQRYTYGAVLILHAISTLSSYRQYWHAFEGNNLLFFAAWPMLAACFALYYLRESDTHRLDYHKIAATKA
ncbi:MAG TPA: hypothetical protein VGR65_10035 [Casimicrobiaceae bacterium]|jgi:hypothetical protein|nr:hypothetical protein [Casimicrobiaceae bacterium]